MILRIDWLVADLNNVTVMKHKVVITRSICK